MDSKRLKQLADELADELNELQKIRALVLETQERLGDQEPKKLELYIPGGVLHDLYKGIEAILARVARHIDLHVPDSPHWHQELLQQMSKPFPNRRNTAVLSADTVTKLDKYRKFRHVFRVIYGFDLDWDRIKPLLDDAVFTVDQFNAELELFINSLRMLADSTDD